MKHKLLKQIKKYVVIGVLVTGTLVVHGCGRGKIYKDDAQEKIKELLEEKYGEEFEVTAIRTETTTVGIPGGTNRYVATANQKDSEESFYVVIGKDGENMKDEYASLHMEEDLKEYVQDLLLQVDNIEIEECRMAFRADEINWKECKDAAEYFRLSESNIIMDIRMQVDSMDEAAEKCDEVVKVLYNNDVKHSIKLWYEQMHASSIIFDDEDKPKTVEEYKEWLECSREHYLRGQENNSHND